MRRFPTDGITDDSLGVNDALGFPIFQTPVQFSVGRPVRWADPAHITVTSVAFNYPQDAQNSPPFTQPLTVQEANLLVAAAHAWEIVSNVHFQYVPDTPTLSNAPDIRVGLAALSQNLNPSRMTFQGGSSILGSTSTYWDGNNRYIPGTTLAVEDPASRPVVSLPNGDLQYIGTSATMFQDFMHEMGHALGLQHNSDPTSIMNPVIGASNRLPNLADIIAIQSLYGPPQVV